MAKSVLLIIGGGIAAYKSLELIRLLKTRGLAVRTIMTKAAEEFVTPLSVASLSGEKVHSALFNLTDEVEMGHIELSRSADLVVVVPATADLMAKMASGLAGDLASTTLLATNKPVLIAPAMNLRMWLHAATQRNLFTLKSDGVHIVGPNEGDMACGEFGPGRMVEPVEILNAIEALLQPKILSGKKILITAGPTREAIDPVRYISNHSSGKQGYALAEAASQMGAEVTLISGPVSLPKPIGVKIINVQTADEMLVACETQCDIDIGIFAAAVADWKVAKPASEKIKKPKSGEVPTLSFVENPDILQTIAKSKNRPTLVVGFAAETEKVIEHAQIKLEKKACDLIIANDVSEGVFGTNKNTVHLVSKSSVETWPELSKSEVASRLMTHIAGMLK
jgi:phosphopantothenoylcysteine decarboxylase / phosphopantothenate---cysteine ligase